MRVSTTDPITLHDVTNPKLHPFVIEGEGDEALKIYFESEDSKRAYLDIEMEHTGGDFESKVNNPK